MSEANNEGVAIRGGWGRFWIGLSGPLAIIGLIALAGVGALIWLLLDLSPTLALGIQRQEMHVSYATAVHEEQKGYLITLLTSSNVQHEKTYRELEKIKYILSLTEEEKRHFRLRMPEGLAEEVLRMKP